VFTWVWDSEEFCASWVPVHQDTTLQHGSTRFRSGKYKKHHWDTGVRVSGKRVGKKNSSTKGLGVL